MTFTKDHDVSDGNENCVRLVLEKVRDDTVTAVTVQGPVLLEHVTPGETQERPVAAREAASTASEMTVQEEPTEATAQSTNKKRTDIIEQRDRRS